MPQSVTCLISIFIVYENFTSSWIRPFNIGFYRTLILCVDSDKVSQISFDFTQVLESDRGIFNI